MDKKVMKVPFSYNEAMRLYHAAQQVKQDFFDFSPYYGCNSIQKVKQDRIKEYVMISLRRRLIEAAGVSVKDREELLSYKDWVIGSTSIKYVNQMYRDPYEDADFGIIESMVEFMEEMGISEYDMRPSALFGYYLLNKDMGTDIHKTLCVLEKKLTERTESEYFYEYDYITYNIGYEDYEDYEEYDFTPLSIEEQRSAMLQFIQEYRLCLAGTSIEESRFLLVIKKYLVYTGQYYMDDATFLKEFPGICVLLFGGANAEFHMGEDICMNGISECDAYLIEDRELVNMIKMFPDKEDVRAITWCLDQMCESGHQARSSYLQALARWRLTDEGIVFSTISCRYTEVSDNMRQGISIFSAYLAPLILDAVSKHAKMSLS